MEKRDAESVQVIPLTAVFMAVMLAFLAPAIDVAMLFRARRNVQMSLWAQPWIISTTATSPARNWWVQLTPQPNRMVLI
jgi:hypothetical protein